MNVTQKQENVSEALKTICCLLDAAPWELGVLSTSKGLIAGPLEIHLPNNSIIDCNIDRNGNFLFNLQYFFYNHFFSSLKICRNNIAPSDVWYC